MLLTGEYFHSIDAKGRMNFPSRLREGLGAQFYITSWFDNCLAVFSEEEFLNISEKIAAHSMAQSREVQRSLAANATMVEPDKQGRILIPASLRERAGIRSEVAVIGSFTRAEIWDKQKWLEKNESFGAKSFDEKMEELGI